MTFTKQAQLRIRVLFYFPLVIETCVEFVVSIYIFPKTLQEQVGLIRACLAQVR